MAEKIVRAQGDGNLVWIDLEMTGLDAVRDVIVQAAVIITTKDLVVLEEYACDVWQPDHELEKMTPFVRDMHQKNGLIERVRASKLELASAEKRLLERITGWCPYPATLCGNSVGQDKRFIDQWMPGLSGYLSYRIVDVSSLKILSKLWYGDEATFKKSDDGEHDALVDIRNSIAELRHYRARVFKP